MALNRLWVQVMPLAVGPPGAEAVALPALIASDLIASGIGAIIKSAADGLIASDQFVIKTVLAYEPSFVIRRNATSASFLLTSMWLNVGRAAVRISEEATRVPRSFDAIRESREYEQSPVVINLKLSESADGTALAAHVAQWKYEKFLSPSTVWFRTPQRKVTVEVKIHDVDGGVFLATAMQVQADKTTLSNVRPNDGERLPWMKRPVKNFPGNRVLDEDQPFGPVNIEVSITEVAEPSRFARFLGATLGSQKAAIEGYVRDRVTGALDESAAAKARVTRLQEASSSREKYEAALAEVAKARDAVGRAGDAAARIASQQSLDLKLLTLRQMEILARAAFDQAGLSFEPIPDREDPGAEDREGQSTAVVRVNEAKEPFLHRTLAMIDLKTVSKQASPFESWEAAPEKRVTPGNSGSAPQADSRSVKYLVVKGKGGPIRPPFETVIGHDERTRILDTDLAPWRQICALRMRGGNGAGAIGTGWFIGPKTVITAGHCVFSNFFFGGWASTIEVIPGLNGNGTDLSARPYGSVTSTRFSSVDRWVEEEEADFDIGCIHLDQPKGEEVGWFAVGSLPPEELVSYLANVAGYPADRGAGAELYHDKNRVLRVSERRLFYETDSFGGQSGAPVWIHESDGAPPIVVGIHAYGVGGTPLGFGITANSAPRIIPKVLAKLEEWVTQDGGWPNS